MPDGVPSQSVASPAPANHAAPGVDCLRLLEAMYPVVSHDLPKQLVIIQSLVALLELEAKDGASFDAADFLGRLHAATGRASAMVRFLKDISRPRKGPSPEQDISLPALGREIRAELNRLFSGHRLEHEQRWLVEEVRAPLATLHQALLELLRWSILQSSVQNLRVGFHSSEDEAKRGTIIALTVIPLGDSAPAPVPDRDPTPKRILLAPEKSMEIVLARELLATLNATLAIVKADDGSRRITISLPNAHV